MFTLDVVLSLVTGDDQVLLDASGTLPWEPMGTEESSEDAAARLLLRLTGVTTRWVRLRPCGFLDRPGPSRGVLFAAEIPEPVPLLEPGPSWRPIAGLIADPARHAGPLQLLTKVLFR